MLQRRATLRPAAPVAVHAQTWTDIAVARARVQMWVELTTMRAPDYFGEAAMLGSGVRHAAAIADSAVEVLVLLKLDFDLKIDAETREVLNVLVSQYPRDANFVQCAPGYQCLQLCIAARGLTVARAVVCRAGVAACVEDEHHAALCS
jgi:hypothetical protein